MVEVVEVLKSVEVVLDMGAEDSNLDRGLGPGGGIEIELVLHQADLAGNKVINSGNLLSRLLASYPEKEERKEEMGRGMGKNVDCSLGLESLQLQPLAFSLQPPASSLRSALALSRDMDE